MSVVVKKSTIKDLVQELFEPSKQDPKAPVVVTEPPLREKPIDAAPESVVDGLFDLPPVEDENFMPTNSVALSKASYALMKDVPPKQISKVYNKLKQVVQDAEGRQKQEDVQMSKPKTADEQMESLKRIIQSVLKEADDGQQSKEDQLDYIKQRHAALKKKQTPVAGMMRDYEEDAPSELKFGDDYISRLRTAMNAKSDEKSTAGREGWSAISLRKKKPAPDVEPFQEPVHNRHYDMDLDQIASRDDVPGLNTNSAVRQFLEDPRKLNLLDKVRFLLNMPPKEREKIITQAAADFLDSLETGKADPIDYKDPAVQEVLTHYISDLEAEGALDPEDSKDLKGRPEYVVELDSFKKYFVDYLDHNIDTLIKHVPFREHLNKYWQKALRSDPDMMAYVERRKEADIARVQKKKAAKKAGDSATDDDEADE